MVRVAVWKVIKTIQVFYNKIPNSDIVEYFCEEDSLKLYIYTLYIWLGYYFRVCGFVKKKFGQVSHQVSNQQPHLPDGLS